VSGFLGKLNTYTCDMCRREIVTKDVDEGVTPFVTSCKSPGCKGWMQSAMYRVRKGVTAHGWEWYRPTDLSGLTAQTRDHVERGGLLLRPALSAQQPGDVK